jgi:hypothetical protein
VGVLLRHEAHSAYFSKPAGIRYGVMAPKNRTSVKPLEPSRGVAASAEKSIVSIRMPVEVLNFVEGESRARAAALGLKGADLENAINITAQINRALEALRTWFGLPAIVAEAAEKDRAALGLGRLEYLQYLVFRRYEATVENGPGFDREGPQAEKGSGGRR